MHGQAIFLVLIFAVTGPLVIWALVVTRRRTAENLKNLANQTGLNFQAPEKRSGPLRVGGELRGRQIDVYTYTTSTGKSSTTWAVASARAAMAFPFTFKLQRQGLGTKIAELFGAHEITVGDVEFDPAWFIRTNGEPFMRAVLLPELRRRLMEARQEGATGTFELNLGVIKYAEVGSFADAKRAKRFVALINLVCDLAEVADLAAEAAGPQKS